MTENEQMLADIVLLGAGLAVVLYREEIVNTATDLIDRGTQLTSTSLDGLVIDDDPNDLAAQAVQAFGQPLAHGPYSDLDVYALARMSRSEAGARDNDISRIVRMHVAINDYESQSWAKNLADLFLYSKNSADRGYFGSQEDGPRRYATTKDPFAGDVLLAQQVIDQRAQGIDLADGATKFVDRKSMGVQHGSSSWDNLVARWGKDGLKPEQLAIDGLPDDFYVFVKA